jgi:hypothetical protein
MEALLTCLHLAAYLAAALGLAVPRLRRPAVAALVAAAAVGLVAGLLAPGERSLTTVHTYAGFEGIDQEVSMVRFPTGTVTAPGWQWGAIFAVFAAVWAATLWRLGDRPLRNPLVAPLLFAWTATAAWLGMQATAAPAAVVQPLGLDRFLWPAGLASALIACRSAARFFGLFVQMGLAVTLARLPAALFSKYASDAGLGTSLDVRSVRDIVNPMTQMQFDPRLQPGSAEQQFWLIWLEHVIFFPAVYLMSLFGIAFGLWLYHRHENDPA